MLPCHFEWQQILDDSHLHSKYWSPLIRPFLPLNVKPINLNPTAEYILLNGLEKPK